MDVDTAQLYAGAAENNEAKHLDKTPMTMDDLEFEIMPLDYPEILDNVDDILETEDSLEYVETVDCRLNFELLKVYDKNEKLSIYHLKLSEPDSLMLDNPTLWLDYFREYLAADYIWLDMDFSDIVGSEQWEKWLSLWRFFKQQNTHYAWIITLQEDKFYSIAPFLNELVEINVEFGLAYDRVLSYLDQKTQLDQRIKFIIFNEQVMSDLMNEQDGLLLDFGEQDDERLLAIKGVDDMYRFAKCWDYDFRLLLGSYYQ